MAGRLKTRVANSGSIMESPANPTWKMDSTNKELCLEWPPRLIINSQMTDTNYLLRPNMLIHEKKPTTKYVVLLTKMLVEWYLNGTAICQLNARKKAGSVLTHTNTTALCIVLTTLHTCSR